MPVKSLDRLLILNITLVMEAILLLVATIWSQFGEIDLMPLFRLNRNVVGAGILAGVATAGTGFLLMWLGSKFELLKGLRNIVIEELVPVFKTLSAADILLVALCSGFCEEIFFRGAVQNQFGIYVTATLFGLFHCPTPRHLPYGIWATFAGLFFGWLLTSTHSIWTPIFAHAINNFLVLLYLRFGRNVAVEDKIDVS